MDLIQFPFERVIEINLFILKTEPGHKGVIDIAKLQGALGRIDNSIAYENLNDIFEIAAKYAASIADQKLINLPPHNNKRHFGHAASTARTPSVRSPY